MQNIQIFCMVAAPPPLPPSNFRGDLKIPDQNNGGDLSKELNLGGAKLRGDLTF